MTLNRAGIHTVRDLLYYLPRDYENYQAATRIVDLQPGKVIVRGRVTHLSVRHTRRRNFTITEGQVEDDTGAIRVVWYNQPYRAKAFDERKDYYLTGTYDFKYNRYQLTSPVAVLATEVDSAASFQPIYPAKSTLKPIWFKKILKNMRTEFTAIPDLLPLNDPKPPFLTLNARANALYNVHFPENQADVDAARQYLAYEELFELLLAACLNKQENQQLSAQKLPFNAEKTRQFVAKLPFKLTNAQRLAAWDILKDLERPTPMNRLLQGDVGSGKTIVAALAAHQAAQNGFQTALLAPTAVLASQHAEGLSRLLGPFDIKTALLTGSTKDKPSLKQQIKSGEINLIIGTHALLTDDTQFKNLALCVIDEQHRFGVEQRQKLLMKSQDGLAPHLLAMTATPIPRSLQLTIFGDLDISVLNQLPKGRQPIKTTILGENQLKDDLYPILRNHLAAGEQIYWICPLIDDGDGESEGASSGSFSPASGQTYTPDGGEAAQCMTSGRETGNTKRIPSGSPRSAVITQAKKLRQIFPKAHISYLHGKMKPTEKDEVMSRFAQGQSDILVSTTVVEVGVDVPNATQIVIMDAEHYGLAQLHQLRGRVGRGAKPSACYLVTSDENPPSRRLRELERSTDGFHLAEVDLKLRGPGEIYGSLQHGALDLRIATLADTELISAARKQVAEFAKDPQNMVKYQELATAIKRYQQLTTLN